MLSGLRPLAKPCRHIPAVPVPAAPLAGALLMKISALYRSCCALVGAPAAWSCSCSSPCQRHHRLSPGARAHYSFKSCQLVTSWHQLIRRKVIFKEPSVVTADPLTLCRVFVGMGAL